MKKKQRMTVMHVCEMDSSAGDLRGTALTYERVKARVLAEGRFSVFEATRNARAAGIYTRLNTDPEIEVTRAGYPWLLVRIKTAPEAEAGRG